MSVHEQQIVETQPSEIPVAEAFPPTSQLVENDPPESPAQPVDPVRAAAGRLGGRRMHELVRLGLEYEREHGLKAGRQRQRQLIQLGRRYELEHGLAVPAARRRKRKGDAWTEFLTALARVVKPAHRAAVEQLVAALQQPRVMAG